MWGACKSFFIDTLPALFWINSSGENHGGVEIQLVRRSEGEGSSGAAQMTARRGVLAFNESFFRC